MKKLSVLGVVTIVLVLFIGCTKLGEIDVSDSVSLGSYYFEGYSEIGQSFYEIMNNPSCLSTDSRNALNDYEMPNNDIYIELDDDESATSFLLENNYISELSGEYIEKIENAIDTAQCSLTEILDAISVVEEEALNSLQDTDLTNVMYYAEISKATLGFYFSDTNNGRSLFSWIESIPKKVKCAIVSGALGAVVGAVVGIVTGRVAIQVPVVGEIAGGVVGAFLCAASSAKSAYDQEKICITCSASW